jgi:hypothetical protein
VDIAPSTTNMATLILPAALLGAFHGVNPAMGWLFAVFLALQRKSGSVLLAALVPITLGHAVSITAVALLLFLAQSTLSIRMVQVATALLILGFAIYKLLTRLRHPRWVGLNIRYWELAWWSFLVATAHGSGLMLAPLIFGLPGADAALTLVTVHTLAMLVVMTGIAVLVYTRLGLAALRRYWINFDILWAVALLAIGVITLLGLVIGPAH